MPKHEDATPHLWIILTDPDPNGMTAIVNITSARPHHDQTTVLKAGEHPFIVRDSNVLYFDAKIVSVESIEMAMSKSNLCVQREPCSEEMFKKISTGIFASDFTKNGVIDFCHKAWNNS